ncbi:hypothetical protein [Scytonema sp. PCC 10023]
MGTAYLPISLVCRDWTVPTLQITATWSFTNYELSFNRNNKGDRFF